MMLHCHFSFWFLGPHIAIGFLVLTSTFSLVQSSAKSKLQNRWKERNWRGSEREKGHVLSEEESAWNWGWNQSLTADKLSRKTRTGGLLAWYKADKTILLWILGKDSKLNLFWSAKKFSHSLFKSQGKSLKKFNLYHSAQFYLLFFFPVGCQWAHWMIWKWDSRCLLKVGGEENLSSTHRIRSKPPHAWETIHVKTGKLCPGPKQIETKHLELEDTTQNLRE